MSSYMDINPAKSSDSAASDGSTAILRERRARQIEQERNIRNRMKRISSPDHVSTISSSGSFDGSVESSLLSLNLSRSSTGKPKNLKWEKINVEFAFGLITAWQDAPTKGQYRKRSSRRNLAVDSSASTSTSTSSYLLDNSPILKQIIRKTGEVCKASVKNRSGNVIIKAKTPHVSSVSLDRSYQPARGREGTVRSYIKAIVPIEISDVNVRELTRSSKIISKIVVREALIEGVRRKIFDPLVELS